MLPHLLNAASFLDIGDLRFLASVASAWRRWKVLTIKRDIHEEDHLAFSGLVIMHGGQRLVPSSITVTDLGTLGGSTSIANGINNSGQVVGWAFNSSGHMRAFFSTTAGSWPTSVRLAALQAAQDGINNSGQIVGDANTSSGDHAFLFSGGTMTDLRTTPGYPNSRAFCINNNGQITRGVRFRRRITLIHRAFLCSGGVMTDLSTVVGPYSGAYGIDASGQVAGYSKPGYPSSWLFHAFLSSGGTMTDLGSLSGNGAVAYGTNAIGQVVGSWLLHSQALTTHSCIAMVP